MRIRISDIPKLLAEARATYEHALEETERLRLEAIAARDRWDEQRRHAGELGWKVAELERAAREVMR